MNPATTGVGAQPKPQQREVVIAEHDVTVRLGDVREQLAAMDAGSVQCVVTSPPYYGLRDYGVDGQLGLEASPAEYVETMRDVFAAVKRVLADDGVLWLNLGDSYARGNTGQGNAGASSTLVGGTRPSFRHAKDSVLPKMRAKELPNKCMLMIPERVVWSMIEDGWILRKKIVWHKPNAMPESVGDRPSSRWEPIFMFAKSERYWFDLDAIKVPTTLRAPGNTPENRRRYGQQTGTANGERRFGGNPGSTLLEVHETRNPGDVWAIPTSPFPGAHFACFPPEIPRRCILAGCPEDGTVLDPFAGSGTTLMVARQLGRASIGIELNPEYVDIIRQRIGPTPFDFAADSSVVGVGQE